MYRSAWKCSVLLAGAVGVWAAVQAWSLGGALFFFLLLAFTAACIRLLMGRQGTRPQWRPAVCTALACGAGGLAALGLFAWLGVEGLAVVTLLSLLSPTVLNALANWGNRRRHSAEPLTPQQRGLSGDRSAPAGADNTLRQGREATVATGPSFLEAPWMERPMDSMDDATLCFAWRTSYVALQQSMPLQLRTRIVQRRQEFLDEFERRNTRGFLAWLTSGARAAGDPTKYITSAPRQVHRHDQR